MSCLNPWPHKRAAVGRLLPGCHLVFVILKLPDACAPLKAGSRECPKAASWLSGLIDAMRHKGENISAVAGESHQHLHELLGVGAAAVA